MSQPPPAYSAVDNGEGNSAPPPSYNSEAPKAPPAYNPSAPVSAPAAAPSPAQPVVTPNIKYVDQNGNPVAPPSDGQPAIKYVDQNGNPVAGPQGANIKYVDQNGNPVNVASQPQVVQQQQPAVKYVDQYGNPVAPPASNIKYVDQNGNPVAPPTAQQPAQQPAVKYVDQYGNPVAPPTAGQPAQQPAVKYVDQYGNPVAPPKTAAVATTAGYPGAPGATQGGGAVVTPQSVRQQKIASAVLGGIALLLLFIGLCVNNLASGQNYGYSSYSYYYTQTCTWTAVSTECDSYYYGSSCTDIDVSYSDLCDLESYDTDSYSTGPSWCGTQTSAALALVAMIIATIFALIGVIYVQPCSRVEPCACKTNPQWTCGRASFSITITFSILSIVIWSAGDEICLGDGSYMGLGGTMICQIIAIIFSFISCLLAK